MQPLENCIGPTVRIGQKILCLPYAGFFNAEATIWCPYIARPHNINYLLNHKSIFMYFIHSFSCYPKSTSKKYKKGKI